MSYYFNPVEDILEKVPSLIKEYSFSHTLTFQGLVDSNPELIMNSPVSGADSLTVSIPGYLYLNPGTAGAYDVQVINGKNLGLSSGSSFYMKRSYQPIFMGPTYVATWTLSTGAAICFLDGDTTQPGIDPLFFIHEHIQLDAGRNFTMDPGGVNQSTGRYNFLCGASEASSGAAVAFSYNTYNAFTVPGDLLVRWLNNGTDRFNIDYDGNVSLNGSVGTYQTIQSTALELMIYPAGSLFLRTQLVQNEDHTTATTSSFAFNSRTNNVGGGFPVSKDAYQFDKTGTASRSHTSWLSNSSEVSRLLIGGDQYWWGGLFLFNFGGTFNPVQLASGTSDSPTAVAFRCYPTNAITSSANTRLFQITNNAIAERFGVRGDGYSVAWNGSAVERVETESNFVHEFLMMGA